MKKTPVLGDEALAFFRKQGSIGGKLGGRTGGKKAAANMTAAERVARAKKAVDARIAKRKKAPPAKKKRHA